MLLEPALQQFVNAVAAHPLPEDLRELRAISESTLTSMIAVAGTRFFDTSRPNTRGNAPSRPMANSTRDTLAWDTMAEAKQAAT